MVRPILAALALVQLLGFASAASAQDEPNQEPKQKWDQLAVTEAANKLPGAIGGLRDLVKSGPALQNQLNRRVVYQILDNLRQMEFTSQTLKVELGKGAGMEETLPTYNRLQQLRRETEVLSQRVDITAVVRPKLEEARMWLKVIEPFYPPQPQVEDLR